MTSSISIHSIRLAYLSQTFCMGSPNDFYAWYSLAYLSQTLCKHLCGCGRAHVHVWVHECVQVYIHACMHAQHVCECVCIRACGCARVYVYARVYYL